MKYSKTFFEGVESTARPSAEAIVPLILQLTGAQSVVDFGCGTGQWLAVFKEHGVGELLGVDGAWVKPSQLKIPKEQFQVADLTQPVKVSRIFDLVISLEVAEHLPGSAADCFVESLIAAGDVVLFSAGVPDQGGCNHVNEQWPEFWIERFRRHRYSVFDCVRKRIWDDPRVSPWYAQNAFLFVCDSLLKTRPWFAERIQGEALGRVRVIHPRLFQANMELMNVQKDPVNMPFSTLLLALPRKACHAMAKRLH